MPSLDSLNKSNYSWGKSRAEQKEEAVMLLITVLFKSIFGDNKFENK